MKLLVVNPNISDSVTELIRAEALRAASSGTEIVAVTASSGVAYIETPAEAVLGAQAAFELIAAHADGCDAAIVAAFGDPGLPAAKEAFPLPVLGLTEAAVTQALLLGGRFAIVGISPRIGAWYRDTVERLGLAGRMCAFAGLGDGFADVGTVQRQRREALLALCHRMVDEEGADSIVLAGAPLAGLAREIAAELPVPLIDGVGSAVRLAEATVRAGFAPRRAGSLAAPPAKPHRGIPPPLARYIGRAGAGSISVARGSGEPQAPERPKGEAA